MSRARRRAVARPPKKILTLLPDEVVADFLTHYRIDAADVPRGKPVWKEADADGRVRLVPLTAERIEFLIGERDPVMWARLNLREVEDVRDDDGRIVIPRGSPWVLLPPQERLARLNVDFIAESGSATGKTRDLVLRALRCAAMSGSVLIETNREGTQEQVAKAILGQIDRETGLGNRGIAGGLVGKPQRAPFWRFTFVNGRTITLIITGADGENALSHHVGGYVLLDEAQRFRSRAVFDHAWRAIDPGCRVGIYGTPSGNFSSPFFRLCASAIPIDGRTWEANRELRDEDAPSSPKLVKINISRTDMGPPFFTPRRKASWIGLFGGEESPGYQNNVLGRWSGGSASVFPMETLLRPCLRVDLPHYRVVVATLNRAERTAEVRAARLSGVVGEPEKLIGRQTMTLSAADLASTIASFYPATDWIAPQIVCGVDLGSSESEPTEALFVRLTGAGRWEYLFRLVLRGADYFPIQKETFLALDHASGHTAMFGFDAGNAGGSFVQGLQEHEACPICRTPLDLKRRTDAYAFGGAQDEIDIETGTLILNPDKRDAAGNALPHRVSNKEQATRHLIRKMQAKALAIADDGGAHDQNLAVGQLLVNHTYEGETSRGEHRYKGEDDHHVDALRQVALVIARQIRDGFSDGSIGADPALCAFVGRDGAVRRADVDPHRAESGEPFMGSVRSKRDWDGW